MGGGRAAGDGCAGGLAARELVSAGAAAQEGFEGGEDGGFLDEFHAAAIADVAMAREAEAVTAGVGRAE